jgi:hypothetical protein
LKPTASVQRWVLAAGAAGFVAGLSIGLLGPRFVEAAAGPSEDDPHARYAAELAVRYDLGPEQVRQVRLVLEERDRAHRRALMRDPLRLPPALRDEVAAANRRAEERIKYVLTDEQRARFLRDSKPAAGAGSAVPVGSATTEDR